MNDYCPEGKEKTHHTCQCVGSIRNCTACVPLLVNRAARPTEREPIKNPEFTMGSQHLCARRVCFCLGCAFSYKNDEPQLSLIPTSRSVCAVKHPFPLTQLRNTVKEERVSRLFVSDWHAVWHIRTHTLFFFRNLCSIKF